MPEYGRHVQKMVEYVKDIPEKEKRNEQIKAVVGVMGILNPQLRDISDFKHKLWDHVQVMSDFEIDVDAPYPIPTKETFLTRPEMIPLEKTRIKANYYGRNIENMVQIVAKCEDSEKQEAMIRALAPYMRQQYLIWNKETVSDEIIMRDIERLSDGKIIVPEHIHLNAISNKEVFAKPMLQQLGAPLRPKNKNKNQNNRKRWKNNK